MVSQQPAPEPAGPIEDLWDRLARGQISAEYAQALSAEPGVQAHLTPAYVRALTAACTDIAYNGRWREASVKLDVVLAAVAALPGGPDATAAAQYTTLALIDVAHMALVDIPDGRIYRRARDAGEALLANVAGPFKSRLLHALGTMLLDPYTTGRDPFNYQLSIDRWYLRLQHVLGPEIAHIPKEELAMPEPPDALSKAAEYLDQAAALRTGHPRGLSLKARAQALVYLRHLGQDVSRDQIVSVCRQALEALDPGMDPQPSLAVLAHLASLDMPVTDEEVDVILSQSFDQYVRRFGPQAAIDIAGQAAQALQKNNPVRALSLLRNVRPLLEQYASDEARLQYWRMELVLLRNAYSPDFAEAFENGSMGAAAQRLRARAEAEGWDVRRLSAGLIALALHCTESSEEAVGLALLQEARARAPLFTAEVSAALDALSAILLHGEGVNNVGAQQWAKAIDCYGRAARAYLALGAGSQALALLRYIDDLSTRAGPDVALQVVLSTAPQALELEQRLGAPGARVLQALYKHTVAKMAADPINPEAMLFLLQAAKGLRFATALSSGIRWQEDEEGAELLNEIRSIEAALPPSSAMLAPPDPAALLDEDLLLSGYADWRGGRGGGSPEEQLQNLRRSYDAHVADRLFQGASPSSVLYMSTADIAAALDDRTVLLSFYLGATPNGNVGVHALTITREDVRAGLVSHPFPDSTITLGDGAQQLEVSPFALTVGALRRDVQAFSGGPTVAASAAVDTLGSDLYGYLGHLVEYLAELRKAGKDHLCIVPHGPLHYYPLHLLGPENAPLAGDWIVTFLPNLQLLASRGGRLAARRYRPQPLAALGLGFQAFNPHGLPPLPQSIPETTAIAGLFGVKPVLDADATPDALLNALRDARYVHLSTHGRHAVEAPSFQTLYLAPGPDQDGRLDAHELLGEDLRGLELVTLSACETALGRFDIADNLRGLPANLLLAGAETIIGTLWPVSAPASERFFVAFYRDLHAGAARLDAFAAAQRETRTAYPRYRDWGAFYLIGDWF